MKPHRKKNKPASATPRPLPKRLDRASFAASTRKPGPRWIAVAAAALLVVGLGAAMFYFGAMREVVFPAPAIFPEIDFSGLPAPIAERIRFRMEGVRAAPRSAERWGRLAMALDVHNLVDEARPCYQRAQRLAPRDFRWVYLEALCMPEARPGETAALLERSLALNARATPAWIHLGEERLLMGQNQQAREAFEEALFLSPDGPQALVGLARLNIAEKNWIQAESLLRKALERNPSMGEAWRHLSRVLAATGRAEEARAAVDRALPLPSKTPLDDPYRREVFLEGATAPHLVWQAGELRREQRTDEALKLLLGAIRFYPNDAELHLQLGITLCFDLGRPQDGIAELEAAAAISPGHPVIQRALADARARLDKSAPLTSSP